jgi:hypothetical protein
MSKPTMKAFREYLNEQERQIGSSLHRHNQYQQRKRAYGDYLYFQDRDKFNVEFEEWIKSKQVRP